MSNSIDNNSSNSTNRDIDNIIVNTITGNIDNTIDSNNDNYINSIDNDIDDNNNDIDSNNDSEEDSNNRLSVIKEKPYGKLVNLEYDKDHSLDLALKRLMTKFETGKNIQSFNSPAEFARELVGYEEYCFQTENAPSWAGLCKFLCISQDRFWDFMKKDEFNEVYGVTKNWITEFAVSKGYTMRNPAMAIFSLKANHGENGVWSDTPKVEVTIRQEAFKPLPDDFYTEL